MNAVEGLVLFAPLAAAVQVTGLGNEMTALACAACFRTRLVYAPLYWFDVPVLKTTAWMVGLRATLARAWQLPVQASW